MNLHICRPGSATLTLTLLACTSILHDSLSAQGSVVESATPAATKQDGVLTATFKNKLVFTSADGSTSIRLGGRIHNDAEASIGKFEDGNEFRRARIYMSGHIHRWLIFKTQYDFEDGEADFKDVYAGIQGLPCIGTFRAGQFKEPFSLEELTSSRFITFRIHDQQLLLRGAGDVCRGCVPGHGRLRGQQG